MEEDISHLLNVAVEYVELSGIQHGFVLPANLRPCKLVGTGGSGVVLCCTTEEGEMVAIKKMISETEQGERRALREVLLMCQLRHPNIVVAQDIYLPSDIPLERRDSALRLRMRRSIADHICVRMPYYPADMNWLIHSSAQVLTPEHVQYIFVQILSGLRYLHAAKVIHRDLKPSNILVAEDCSVCICDFGLARCERRQLLSQYVVTRWYRPPEVLLCKRQYSNAVDIWSAGCIFAELIMQPSPHRAGLFPGHSYMDQTDKIINMLGAPSEEDLASVCDDINAAGYVRAQYMSPPILQSRLVEHLQQNARPGYISDALLDLIVHMLCFNPRNRITAVQALQHPYFADCEEARIDDSDEPVAEPDDGEERSLEEIIAMIKRQQVLLRSQRERQFSAADLGLPGM